MQFIQTLVAGISECLLISTVYLESLENVWTVQVRHLLALETLAGPLGKDACPIQQVQERTRAPK